MKSDESLAARARDGLVSVGYPLVLTEVRLPFAHGRHRTDVVAFAADATGALRPSAAVEVKQRAQGDEQGVLDQLALVREALGTRHHYLLSADGWREADPGLRSLSVVDGPVAPDRTGGTLADPQTLTLVLQQWLAAATSQLSGQRSTDPALNAVLELLPRLGDDISTVDGQRVRADGSTLWQAVGDVVRQQLVISRGTTGFLSPPALARPLASLLGNALPRRISDPFAGLGSFLWAVADRAIDTGTHVELFGADVNAAVVDLAEAVARLCPIPLTLTVEDSFTAPAASADAVISQPPEGLRLAEPYELSNGDRTRDGQLAAIDACLRRLNPGGRAVLHLSRAWTFGSGDAKRFRAYLAQEWRVGALIGLPSGAYNGSPIPSVILVVDREPPSETFVAQLEADWAVELAPGGDVLRHCLAHLDGEGVMRGVER